MPDPTVLHVIPPWASPAPPYLSALSVGQIQIAGFGGFIVWKWKFGWVDSGAQNWNSRDATRQNWGALTPIETGRQAKTDKAGDAADQGWGSLAETEGKTEGHGQGWNSSRAAVKSFCRAGWGKHVQGLSTLFVGLSRAGQRFSCKTLKNTDSGWLPQFMNSGQFGWIFVGKKRKKMWKCCNSILGSLQERVARRIKYYFSIIIFIILYDIIC